MKIPFSSSKELPGDFEARYKSRDLKDQIADEGMWQLIPAVTGNLDGKPGDGNPPDGKPGDGNKQAPPNGKPGDGNPPDGKPGKGAPPDGKPGDMDTPPDSNK